MLVRSKLLIAVASLSVGTTAAAEGQAQLLLAHRSRVVPAWSNGAFYPRYTDEINGGVSSMAPAAPHGDADDPPNLVNELNCGSADDLFVPEYIGLQPWPPVPGSEIRVHVRGRLKQTVEEKMQLHGAPGHDDDADESMAGQSAPGSWWSWPSASAPASVRSKHASTQADSDDQMRHPVLMTTVSVQGLPIFRRRDELCSALAQIEQLPTQCPVAAGQLDMSYAATVPNELPRGDLTIETRAVLQPVRKMKPQPVQQLAIGHGPALQQRARRAASAAAAKDPQIFCLRARINLLHHPQPAPPPAAPEEGGEDPQMAAATQHLTSTPGHINNNRRRLHRHPYRDDADHGFTAAVWPHHWA